jgi:hypothetical protein
MVSRKMGGLDDFLKGSGGEAPAEVPGTPPPINALLAQKGELPAPMARIVRSTMTLDIEDAYRKTTEGLRRQRTTAHRLEYGEIVAQLDEASDLHLLATQLQAVCAVTVRRYSADLEVLTSDMRAQARKALQGEKPDKGGKTITDADVEARMAASYPAEYRRLTGLFAEAEATKRFVDTLPDQWASRRRELDGLVRTVRKT